MPVYLWDDRPWLPYEGSPFALSALGFSGRLGNLRAVVSTLKQTSNATLWAKLAAVRDARHWYTMEGVLEQIGLFVTDPLGPGGGLLRCSVKGTDLASVLDIQLRRG